MAKIKFREAKLSKENKVRLELINEIIEEYQSNWYVLTLRQLYYQLVTRNVIANSDSEYKKLWTLLKEGRMAWIVDWDAIEDRVRKPSVPYSVDDIPDAIEDTIDQYRLDRMKDQEIYIEVWVEKDALSGVLKRVTEKFHIPIIINRWYSSASAMFDAYIRFSRAHRRNQRSVVIYLGDYDPSWIDMIRDIRDRTLEFIGAWSLEFEIKAIALTREQIDKYNPPPNPAKKKDPRSKKFISKNWSSSWEVDALKPEVLDSILTNSIISLIDLEKYQNLLDQEKIDKTILEKIRDDFNS